MKLRYLLCILDIFFFLVCFFSFHMVGGHFFWLGLDLAVRLELVSETLAARWDAVPDF